MTRIFPDTDLMVLLQQAVKVLGIDYEPWPPVSSNGPGHARYRRLIVTDRAGARQMARQYSRVFQESFPWAEVRGIAAFWDDCREPEEEGLQQFHLILMVRVIDRTQSHGEQSPVASFIANEKLPGGGEFCSYKYLSQYFVMANCNRPDISRSTSEGQIKDGGLDLADWLTTFNQLIDALEDCFINPKLTAG